MSEEPKVAYFSMEIALEPGMPTYSGGLGVLAGDTIRAAADLKISMAAVSLLHRKGYFQQKIDASGWQIEKPVDWTVEEFLTEMPQRASVTIEGRTVQLRSWKYAVHGVGGADVPVYLLDTDLPENSEWDRRITDFLYGGDQHYRLCQEIVLGIGGVRMLRSLGYNNIERFHMNEGHASLLTLELLDEEAKNAGRKSINHDDVEAVRKKCVFTTHTPVPAGHDQFPLDVVNRVLGRRQIYEMKEVFCCEDRLNMTYLALNLSHYKRADLLFADIERLRTIGSKAGSFQVVYAGNAHPQDHGGKELIKRIFEAKRSLGTEIKVVYLENYDMELGKIITSGVDLWLNTPQPPLEASGTSGMKAAINGVPSLSILDGWWVEGCIEGVTGWSIGENGRGAATESDRSKDAHSLYDKLEQIIIPMFYRNRDRFIDLMLHSIALNGSFFNTQRMILQYVQKAYF